MSTRFIKNKLSFYKSVQKGRNKLLLKLMDRAELLKTKWIRDLKSKMMYVNLTFSQVKAMKFEEIKETLREWDEHEWRSEMCRVF